MPKTFILGLLFLIMCSVTSVRAAEPPPDESALQATRDYITELLCSELNVDSPSDVVPSVCIATLERFYDATTLPIERYVLMQMLEELYTENGIHDGVVTMIVFRSALFTDADTARDLCAYFTPRLKRVQSDPVQLEELGASLVEVYAYAAAHNGDAVCVELEKVIRPYHALLRNTDMYKYFLKLSEKQQQHRRAVALLEKNLARLKESPNQPKLAAECAAAAFALDRAPERAFALMTSTSEELWRAVGQSEQKTSHTPNEMQMLAQNWEKIAASAALDQTRSLQRALYWAQRFENVCRADEKEQARAAVARLQKVCNQSTAVFDTSAVAKRIDRVFRSTNRVTGQGRVVRMRTPVPLRHAFSTMLYMPSGNVLLVPYEHDEIRLYNPRTNKCAWRYPVGQKPRWGSAVLLNDGRAVMLPACDSVICVYDEAKNSIIRRCKSPSCAAAALSADNVLYFYSNSPTTPGIYTYSPRADSVQRLLRYAPANEKCLRAVPLLDNRMVFLFEKHFVLFTPAEKNKKCSVQICKPTSAKDESDVRFFDAFYTPNGIVCVSSHGVFLFNPARKNFSAVSSDSYDKLDLFAHSMLLPGGSAIFPCCLGKVRTLNILRCSNLEELVRIQLPESREEKTAFGDVGLLTEDGDVVMLLDGMEVQVYRPAYKLEKMHFDHASLLSPLLNSR